MRMRDVTALATCAWLVVVPCGAETGKNLSQTDIRKINEATQAAMNAALAKDFAAWAALFLDDSAVYPPNEPAVTGPPGAPGPIKDSGRFVTVLRRQHK